MKFVAGVAMAEPDLYVPLARAAEEAGFDAVSVPDSIGYPQASDTKYPYNQDGSREFLENKPFIEPLIAAAAMATATERVSFYTSVLKLPIRHPVIFAKEVSSLAVLSHNRFCLGAGTSPWPDDYRLVELAWAGRGRRFEECVAVIRGLCAGGYFEFHGECYDFPPVKLNPVPTEPVRVLIGGHSEAIIERAARIGDGWIAAGGTDEDLARMLERLNEHRRRHDRLDIPFEIHATTISSFSPEGIRRLEEMGVTHTSGGMGGFNPYGLEPDTESLAEKVDNLRRYADTVIGPSRS